MTAFDQMALARNMMALSDDDKLVAMAWLETASGEHADDLDRGLLAGILDSTFEFTVIDGQMRFKLSDAGRAVADRIIAENPDAQRMLATLRGSTHVDGPKDKQ